jgi:AAA15 family ATPase/GTPase
MIINFSIENFRSIKEKVTLSFEADSSKELDSYYIMEPIEGLRLLKLGMIYGANASGKTNILLAMEALRKLILEPVTKKTDQLEASQPFTFTDKKDDKTSFEVNLVANKTIYEYRVAFNNEAVLSESLYVCSKGKPKIYSRSTDIDRQLTKIEFGPKIRNLDGKKALEGNTLWNNTVLGGYLKTNIEIPELQTLTDWFKKTLKPIVTLRTELVLNTIHQIDEGYINKKLILTQMQKADNCISDILLEEKEFEINDEILKLLKKNNIPQNKIDEIIKQGKISTKETFFQHAVSGKKYNINLDDESAGTKRYFGLSGLLGLLINGNTIIPVDELESSLHPDLIKHFLLMFLVNSKKSQLLCTTHHRELLMEKDILRKDAIWFTERKEDGSTDLYSMADFDTSIIRKTSSVYNAYKIGKLGATPNLSDDYLEQEDVEKE